LPRAAPCYLIIETAFTVVQVVLVGVFLALSSRAAAAGARTRGQACRLTHFPRAREPNVVCY